MFFHFFLEKFGQIRKKLAADVGILGKNNLAGRSRMAASLSTRLHVKYEFLFVDRPLHNVLHREFLPNLGLLG